MYESIWLRKKAFAFARVLIKRPHGSEFLALRRKGDAHRRGAGNGSRFRQVMNGEGSPLKFRRQVLQPLV